jgi:CDP-paratose 2-epimerase
MNAPPQDPPRTLGFVQWFRVGERQQALAAAEALQKMGVGHLRTHLSWADYYSPAGQSWYDWLLPMLAKQFELLPCLHYTPPHLAENGRTAGPPRDLKALADFVDHVITTHGALFSWLELWNEPNNLLDWDWRLDRDWLKFCTMFGAAAYWARQRGKRVVLPATSPTDLNWLRLMGQRGILGVSDAVGVHGFPDTWESSHAGVWQGWDGLIADLRAEVAPFNPALEFWITETGYSTWRNDPVNQLNAFDRALKTDVERVYWYSLRDLDEEVVIQEGPHFDERHYHFGIDEADGTPKLLGRLLRAGWAKVQDVAAPLAAPALGKTKPVLVTGGAGFIGANLADRLAAEGEHVLVQDTLARPGVELNLAWLRRRHPQHIGFLPGDVRDRTAVRQAVADCRAVFHLAAQVAVTTSLEAPRQDLQTNILGTFNLLEALRRRGGGVPLIFASTNKVYGDLEQIGLELRRERWLPREPDLLLRGFDEELPLAFATPYGCSKGAAEQYVLDYATSFGVPGCALRMSCIYGPRQFGTEDQGWVAHFIIRALRGEPITLFGDGCQVRDILYVGDAVATYLAAWRRIGQVNGRAYNLGGGPTNAVSVNELLAHLAGLLGRKLQLRRGAWRAHDQRYFVADSRRVREALALAPPLPWRKGVRLLFEELAGREDMPSSPRNTVAARLTA